ncbi:alanine/ornithine racemase family PLP-dependent enzyme [Tepidibacter mesophilus]|uniref:alanine/ornithine racemase family PLP-dependent enzyme n=1 Tax=Tepidibacter mesophilus TaxID=655607 RepID=UPI000C079ACD|nr:alanine/ornithine racemase family PLP-dependent enzyme [Tepidibacter mesophilus]
MSKNSGINQKYPILEIDLNKIYQNTKYMVDLCDSRGISIASVAKGFNGLPKVVEQFVNAGCKYIAHSRIEQIIKLKEHGINVPFMLIRIPMFSEIEELVKYVDISLNSELETLNRIEYECKSQNNNHKVVLMFDLGDIREGIIDEKEFIELAMHVENKLENVQLYGIGTNLGCYGSIMPTKENLGKLCDIAEKIEKNIDRKLDIVSGGATTSIPLIIDGKMPNKINNLRIGEGIILARDLKDYWGYDIDKMNQDTFVLKAQVVEIKDKPSYPIGEMFIDAFGNKPDIIDRGIRKRAILAVGKQDFASHDKLIPQKQGVEIIGSSSDHLIVDVENCKQEIQLGDILDFHMYYSHMLYLSGSSSVTKVYV